MFVFDNMVFKSAEAQPAHLKKRIAMRLLKKAHAVSLFLYLYLKY